MTEVAMLSDSERERRRRGRNWALLIALLCVAALFFAITMVRLRSF